METLVTEADISGTFSPLRIAPERPAGRMYWTDDHAIRRARTNGTQIQVVIDWDPVAFGGPFDIAIDVPGNEVPATSIWAVVLLTLLLTGTATVILRRPAW